MMDPFTPNMVLSIPADIRALISKTSSTYFQELARQRQKDILAVLAVIYEI